MKFYYTNNSFFGTLAEAKAHARFIANDAFDDQQVSEVDVATTKENMLRMLNDGGGIMTTKKEIVFIANAKKNTVAL